MTLQSDKAGLAGGNLRSTRRGALVQLLPLALAGTAAAREAVGLSSRGPTILKNAQFDILDAQVHLGRGEIQSALKAMDSLGIASLLAYEFWGRMAGGDPGNTEPGYLLPNGAWRTANPTAEEASVLYPNRFSYVVKVDRRDPNLESILDLVKSTPHRRAIRILPVRTDTEAASFRDRAYDHLFAMAEERDIPVFVFVPGNVDLVWPYLGRFPKLRIAIDHCGMPFPGIPGPKPLHMGPEYFGEVLKLAAHSNVFLKWSHAPDLFGVTEFPYEGLRPFLRRAIKAFGAERVMWASDHTVIKGQNWADLLYCLRDDPTLSIPEKEWLLGRSARGFLTWPKPPASGA